MTEATPAIGNEVALGSESSFQLIDPRTGAEESRIVGDSVSYDNLRSVVTVENSGVVEASRLPDLDNPLAAATLPSETSVYAVVGDDLVVGDGRRLSVSDDDEQRPLRNLKADVFFVAAGSDEMVFDYTVGVAADDETDDVIVAIAELGSPQGRRLWSRSGNRVAAFYGETGAAIAEFDGDDTPAVFLDQMAADVIVASEAGDWDYGAEGLLLVEPERVSAFDYAEQAIAWTFGNVTESSSVGFIDKGVIVIDPDGTVRLYE